MRILPSFFLPAARCWSTKRSHASHLKADAFTLAETLVGIVLVAILTLTVLLSLQETRRKGRDMQCLSHLRQLAAGCFNYAADHGGGLPFGYTPPPRERWTGATAPFWYVAVAPYVGVRVRLADAGELESPGIFACPADKVPFVMGAVQQRLPSCSYAFPIGLAAVRMRPTLPNPLRLQLITQRSRTVMLVDSVFGNVFNPPTITSTSAATNDPDEPMNRLYQRHRGVNAVFLDGHGEFLPAPVPAQAPPDQPYLWGPVLGGVHRNL